MAVKSFTLVKSAMFPPFLASIRALKPYLSLAEPSVSVFVEASSDAAVFLPMISALPAAVSPFGAAFLETSSAFSLRAFFLTPPIFFQNRGTCKEEQRTLYDIYGMTESKVIATYIDS
ncbi:hypothetical protein RvY_10838 [Ramazzottius varieornatus]|uniref:Uncharacterized protein n=1 Tax=Ramazzottius varieornatus TaxID=947166 RepID=A0A1D1VLW8_RAMVA|nr:hypothetical protein RvY_10838 [Ramazzottius varieornatus]